jgi:hypothetical protein
VITKLSATNGIDKSFWLDFSNTVLKEVRTRVEEVDPIDWLLSLANDGPSASASKPAAKSTTTSSAAKSGWDEVDDVLGALNDIQNYK